MDKSTSKKIIKNIIPYGLIKKYEEKKSQRHDEYYEPVTQREFYNAHGERVRTFFLKDSLCIHQPWGFVYGRTPQTILWDRMHPGLTTHFYTHSDILRTVGNPQKKFAYLLESETIVPDDYKIFDRFSGLDKEFDLIFTHSEKILNQFSNARFLPASGVWYGNEISGKALDIKQYERKEKRVSIIASNKESCKMHSFRKELALTLKKGQLADTFGTFDGGKRVDFIDSTLSDYRYQIVVENEISSYYFTEKILNCFASLTIPIYIGANKIGEFFNEDGIIRVERPTIEQVLKVLTQCTDKYYEEHIPAIIDNFNRVQNFLCVEDYLIKNYGNYLD